MGTNSTAGCGSAGITSTIVGARDSIKGTVCAGGIATGITGLSGDSCMAREPPTSSVRTTSWCLWCTASALTTTSMALQWSFKTRRCIIGLVARMSGPLAFRARVCNRRILSRFKASFVPRGQRKRGENCFPWHFCGRHNQKARFPGVEDGFFLEFARPCFNILETLRESHEKSTRGGSHDSRNRETSMTWTFAIRTIFRCNIVVSNTCFGPEWCARDCHALAFVVHNVWTLRSPGGLIVKRLVLHLFPLSFVLEKQAKGTFRTYRRRILFCSNCSHKPGNEAKLVL